MGKRERDERNRGPPRQYDARQARQQTDRMENDGMEQAADFNIWYGPRKKRRGKEKAPSRCDPARDCGVTRGSEAGALEFCIFFARGACARGYSCHKLHFIPIREDDEREDNMHDCFGRDRSGVEDDDRDGVGCFLKENRTLWVGGVPISDEASARERVRRNFGAWGRISSVRLVKSKSCAFVQYAYRANAEFAKEAMANQALLTCEEIASSTEAPSGEGRVTRAPGPRRPTSSSVCRVGDAGEDRPVLHVRWAAEDPNPQAVMRARTVHAQTLLAAQVATGALPHDVTGPLKGADRALLRKTGMSVSNRSQVDLEHQNTQRQYLALQGNAAAGGHYPYTDHQYPDTDHQFPDTDHQYPDTDHQYPDTDHQYPDTDHRYPDTDHQYPNTDQRYPSTGYVYPATEIQYPDTDHRYPNDNQCLKKYRRHPTSADSKCRHPQGAGGSDETSIRAAGSVFPVDPASTLSARKAGGMVDGTMLRFASDGGDAGGTRDFSGGCWRGNHALQDDSRVREKQARGSSGASSAQSSAAAGEGKGVSRSDVSGGALSLLGGYGSDSSD